MDFLAAVKQKLQELEEQARLMELGVEVPGGRPAKSTAQRQMGKGERSRREPRHEPSRTGHVPQERFETPACPTADKRQAVAPLAEPLARPRLVDDLHGRLDEAFLLSEILGSPRCVRGWDD